MSNDTELTELCPHCLKEIAYRRDTTVLDEIINGGSPTFSLPVCPLCMHELLPCYYCHIDETDCSNCPFEKYRKDKAMTEEKKTPSLEEIVESFNNKCHCNYDNDYDTEDCRPCDYCKILHPDYDSLECYKKGKWIPGCDGSWDSQGECERHYIYEVATGKRDINTPLWNPPETPEWFKVGAKLWRKSYNDWYTISSITDTGEVTADGTPTFNVAMVASDGSEDEATLTAFAFTTEAPFSESFRQLIGKRAFHKEFGVLVDIIEYDYEDNTVLLSYTDKYAISNPVWEEFNEENFGALEVPSWFKAGQWIGVTKYFRAIGEIVGVNGTVIEVDWTANSEPVDKQFDVACDTQVLAFIPVKFRPYKSTKELEALLGKKLHFKREAMGGGSVAVETITSVEYDSFDGAMNINLRPYEFYTEDATTTIDGLPIGVPVVDEELLSNT